MMKVNEKRDLRIVYERFYRNQILVNYNMGGVFFFVCLFLLIEGFGYFEKYTNIAQSWLSVVRVAIYDLGIIVMVIKTKGVRRGHWFFWPKIMLSVTGVIITFLMLLKMSVLYFY